MFHIYDFEQQKKKRINFDLQTLHSQDPSSLACMAALPT